MDFAGAAGRPDPDPAISDALLRDLSMSRAWALVMTRKRSEAEPLFAHARLTKPQGRDPFWLYLLNISALNKHRLGHLEEAFSFEHTIEEALASFDPPDWHMHYINSINLARLYRFAGEYDRAQGYFKSAFAISEGLRSESDQVYLNLCQSGIEEAMGRLAEALMARFRAALHWLSMPVPEALAPRVARAMSVESGLDLVARVSAYLEGTLTTLLEQIGPPFSALVDVPLADMPVFRHVTSYPEGPLAMVIGGPGWGLLARQDRRLSDQVRPEQQPLARLVARLVTLLNPDSELSDSTSLILAPCFGTELPTTWCELGALAVRHGCQEVRFRDRRMTLDGGQIASAENRGHIEVGPGVDGLARNDTGLLVTFCRSRQPILVDTADGHLMERARTRPSIPDLAFNLACSAKEIVLWARRLQMSGLLVIRPAIDNDAPFTLESQLAPCLCWAVSLARYYRPECAIDQRTLVTEIFGSFQPRPYLASSIFEHLGLLRLAIDRPLSPQEVRAEIEVDRIVAVQMACGFGAITSSWCPALTRPTISGWEIPASAAVGSRSPKCSGRPMGGASGR